MARERDRFLADAFDPTAIAGNHIGLMIENFAAGRAASTVSASAVPTDVATPWPSGPVVVSTPAGMTIFRMTGRLRAELAGILQAPRSSTSL